MCQLQEIQLSCGHSRKVLHKACASAQRLSIAPVRLPPSHCLDGLHVVHTTKSHEQCGRTVNGLTCLNRQAQLAIDQKIMDVGATMEQYDMRMANIRKAVERFEKSPQDGCRCHRASACPGKEEKFQVLRRKFLLGSLPRWEKLVQDITADMARTYEESLKALKENDKQVHDAGQPVRMESLKSLLHGADSLVEQFGNSCWVWQFDMTCIVDSAESGVSWEDLGPMGWPRPRPEDTRMMAVLEEMLSNRQPRGYYRTGEH